jgi:BASS family bile acid:Na+ symporter
MLATLTAEKLVNDLFNAGLFVMIVTLVMSLGMGFTVGQVLAPLRRVGIVAAALVINVLIVPLIAWGLANLFPITSEQVVGLVLVCIASAGPAGLKAAQLAKRADMALAVSLVIVLQLINIVAAPLWAQAVVSGATVSALTIIKDLLLLVLVPLVVGLVGHARYTEHAADWKAALERISNIALYIAIVAGLAVNWSDIVSLLGSWVLVAASVMILIFMALGAVIGLKDRSAAISGAMVTGMRFQPIGLIIITTQLGGDSAYLAPALVFALIDTFLMFGIGIEVGHRGGAPPGASDDVAAVS